MADTSRGLIKYTSRDYNSIMEEFFELVPKLTDLWKPEADADPGVVLGKILASAADMLGVNVDFLANELYAPSVTQRKNAERLFSLIGYNLGWYTAAVTEVTFKNVSDSAMKLDFGFSGSDFSTLRADTDITNQPRTITYNVLPLTNTYGNQESRSVRRTVTSDIDIFTDTDRVTLQAGESVTRVAIEGELRSCNATVEEVKKNGYIINLPSQHIDTTAVWLKVKENLAEDFVDTRWLQVDSVADFADGEPRFCVTYDSYGNAQIQVSTVLNQLENYDGNIFIVYWFDCSGVIGSVAQDVLGTFLPAITNVTGVNDFVAESLNISNLANTVELPHTYTVTGKSPETAKEAYYNSRNYINTWNSLITIPDYNRFIRREAGVDSGLVIDCQKALEINLAIYKNTSLTAEQKRKQYLSNGDFPISEINHYSWRNILADAGVSDKDIKSIVLIGGCAHMGGLRQKMEDTIKIKVRMGQNPPTLNILNSEINRMEYIEVFSLLATAADRIADGETCVDLKRYEDALVMDHDDIPEQPIRAQEEPKKPVKEPKKGSWSSKLGRLRDKLSGLITEDEDTEDDQ